MAISPILSTKNKQSSYITLLLENTTTFPNNTIESIPPAVLRYIVRIRDTVLIIIPPEALASKYRSDYYADSVSTSTSSGDSSLHLWYAPHKSSPPWARSGFLWRIFTSRCWFVLMTYHAVLRSVDSNDILYNRMHLFLWDLNKYLTVSKGQHYAHLQILQVMLYHQIWSTRYHSFVMYLMQFSYIMMDMTIHKDRLWTWTTTWESSSLIIVAYHRSCHGN